MTVEKLPADKPQRTAEDLRKSLHTCEMQMREVKALKKSVTASYNDQIKDINDEITGILEQLDVLEPKNA